MIHAQCAHGQGQALVPFDYEPAPMGAHDVDIKITHCGVCHSDVHMIDNDWGFTGYPLVPGHEIIGTVTAKGDAVTGLEIGQRVGVGWQRSACHQCAMCLSGNDNLCPQNTATIVGNHGGFADAIRTDGRYAIPVPDGLDSAAAAPLLCGGVTVFSPMLRHKVNANTRVGVVGIGGLGHMALQFARAMGAQVTAFSRSPDKRDQALALGADKFVVTTDPDQLAASAGQVDFLLNTVSGDIDYASYLNCVAPNGTFCLVGVGPAPVSVPAFALLGGQKTITGSVIGGRNTLVAMFDVAARHGVGAQIEALPLSQANEAIARVKANKPRFRMVLTA